MRQKVTITQHRLFHYRVALFEEMKARCVNQGIELRVLHGNASMEEKKKHDEGYLAWADRVENWFWQIKGQEILWQLFPSHLRDSDLVIVMQENRILSNYSLLLQSQLGRQKVAYWGHGINFQSDAPHGLREKWKRFLLTKVDWWFAYTQMTVDILRHAGFPGERITCLNNTIDTRGFRRDLDAVTPEMLIEVRRHHRLEKGAMVGLFCGSLYPEKKLDLLVAAADLIYTAIPKFHLVVIGDGPSAGELYQAFTNRPWAFWVGVKRGVEKAAYFKLAKVMLNPGLVGLHVVDAFCAGLPIVSTFNAKHSPEIAYLENGVNGCLTSDTADDYASAVISLLQDSAFHASISQAAFAASKKYSIENMAACFVDGIVRCVSR